ncbi:50S ribosomal protein L23 [Patescibacteria group bacterium]|nr:50S ribosomal protein L23 [Patescibacteria group bacterium]
MSIFDRFKKTKPEEKKTVAKKEPLVRVVKKPVKPVKKEAEPKIEKPKAYKKVVKKEFSEAWRILKNPLVTEKSTDRNTFNQYIFKVADRANKTEIKNAVQDLYGVRVVSVNIIKVPGKKRRLGKHEGWRPGYKKAVVFLPPEEKIEIIAR